MEVVKKPTDIKKLTFNDVAFFLEVSTSEAKWKMAYLFFGSEAHLEKNLTKTGVPKISIKDVVQKEVFETEIKSCTELDGKNNIDFHIETFNKGVPLSELREYAESKGFISALKFTGKHQILNQILNKDQLFLLQKKWLLTNVYNVHRWSKNTIKFIEQNEWSMDYLSEYILFDTEFERQKEYLEQKK